MSVFLTADPYRVSHNPLSLIIPSLSATSKIVSQQIVFELESSALRIYARNQTLEPQPELLVGKFNAELEVELQLPETMR